jgi:uncharacterized MAPEG superfamily protein
LIVLREEDAFLRAPLDGAEELLRAQYSRSLPCAAVTRAAQRGVARVLRAHRNMLVNTEPFLVLGLVMVLIGTTKTTAMAYFGTFVAARLGHTFAYLAGKQPWRSIFLTIGQLAILGVVYQVVRAGIAGPSLVPK